MQVQWITIIPSAAPATLLTNHIAFLLLYQTNAGQAKTVIAGGAETMSDVPIRFPKKARAWLMQLSRARSNSARLQLLKQFRPSFLAPEAPAIAEVTPAAASSTHPAATAPSLTHVHPHPHPPVLDG